MKLRKLIFTALLGVLGMAGTAQAGHLFVQSGPGNIPAPVALATGQSLDIEWVATGACSTCTNLSTFFSGDWNVGDIMRIQVGNGVNEIIDIPFGSGSFNDGFRNFSRFSGPQGAAWGPLLVVGGVVRITALAGSFTVAGLNWRVPGSLVIGTWASFGTFISDSDGDGVDDGDDFCPNNTAIPEAVPTSGALNPNHWALTDDDGDFDTVIKGKGKGPNRSYTIEDTAGCSCEQIIEIQGLGDGHSKHGCSISAMDDWIETFVNP